MEEKIYIISIKDRADLEEFYKYMSGMGFKLQMKRPLSRNTHYWLTKEQANELAKDPRIAAIELTPEEQFMEAVPMGYTKTGGFHKDYFNLSPSYYQWGHLHCAGTQAQRRRGTWSSGTVNDSVEVFGAGKDVDVVICDEPMSYDCAEWISPTTGLSRFVQYQWYNNLSQYVGDIDDDDVGNIPTGIIQYYSNNENPYSHSNHVGGTIAGRHYGWANEANIYNMPLLGNLKNGPSIPPYIAMDYLRAFHRYKEINPTTGRKNPTITNHSWGYSYNWYNYFGRNLQIQDFDGVIWDGIRYNASNPNPSGWNMDGILKDFGINSRSWPASSNMYFDVEDAIEEGVVVIGASGNDGFFIHRYENISAKGFRLSPFANSLNYRIELIMDGSIFFVNPWGNGQSPSNANGFIVVGALDDNSDFRKADFSNYGPNVTIFAPGVSILSCVSKSDPDGFPDTKYPAGNYYASYQGTSMASPQVAGIAAIIAGMSKKHRFTNKDLMSYLSNFSVKDDMSFDVLTGDFSDPTKQAGSPNAYLSLSNPRFFSPLVSQSTGNRQTRGTLYGNSLVYPRQNISRYISD